MSPLHPLAAARWSPWAFDPAYEVTADELAAVLEAARWSPSEGNSQPWRFLVGRRGDATFTRIVGTLKPRNITWAPRASVLLIAVYDDGADRPLRHAQYDLGQAMAHASLQAVHEGLVFHQMAGFSPELAREAFAIPDGFHPFTAAALGRSGDPADLPEDLAAKQARTRTRRPLADTAWSDWGTPLDLG